MDEPFHDPSPGAPLTTHATMHGYTRAAVDGFLADVERERRALRETIERSRARETRARAVTNVHNVMLTMIIESSRELHLARQRAQAEAAEIIARGEAEAAAIRNGSALPEPSAADHLDLTAAEQAPVPPVEDAGILIDRGTVIDLRVEPALARAEPSVIDNFSPLTWNAPSVGDAVHTDDSYLSFLRGALVDDEPLGPRVD